MDIFGDYPAWMALVLFLGTLAILVAEAGNRREGYEDDKWDHRMD